MAFNTVDQLLQMKGRPVYSQEGEKIGKVEDLYYDDTDQHPEWIGIGTGGLFGGKHHLVPVEGANQGQDGLVIPYGKDLVKDSPSIDEDEISEDQEMELYEYYGLRRNWDANSGMSEASRSEMTGAQTYELTETYDTADASRTTERDFGGDASYSSGRPGGDESITRSEEEMRIGKRQVQDGHVRLRKWVETTPVTETVQLRRETAHIEREPINERVTDAQIGEQEIEFDLSREEAIVQKETVAKERLRLEKDVEVEDQQVTENLRREEVEVDPQPMEHGRTGTINEGVVREQGNTQERRLADE